MSKANSQDENACIQKDEHFFISGNGDLDKIMGKVK
jgi:hypothetical protein